MRILAVSDQVVSLLQSSQAAEHFAEVELIVGCGDLPANYLEHIVSVLNKPLLYVPGNHDPDIFSVPGGISIDGRIECVGGVRIAGLGGSRRYKPDGRHQYSEAQMQARVLRLVIKRFLTRGLHGRGLDILVTHAPPQGIHDAQDLAHTGFGAFLRALRWFRPKLMLHGHAHAMRNIEVTVSEEAGCTIINVFPYRIVDIPYS
jgi:Icc-related predicted phosphoesterase